MQLAEATHDLEKDADRSSQLERSSLRSLEELPDLGNGRYLPPVRRQIRGLATRLVVIWTGVRRLAHIASLGEI